MWKSISVIILMNGLKIQFGINTSNVRNTTVTFPVSFNNPPAVTFSYFRGGSCEWTLYNITKSTFDIKANENGNGGSWVAIGY